ncbi:hypothetical protein KUTeg_007981 [Tegillarca granosa]|uniref:Integrator complex subunit 10 n=1 Tax=Tegillarca granosa TaxID=220873 RepID=A0ABQ9FEV1_TEGGR|nr:hypothetical protein KUTeg_007981 [Tegillarca granosa]
MAASMNVDVQISDEDWLVSRARTCMKSDPFAAKSWMITARTLFPKNFTIQFEAYNLEKIGKNVKEAAKLLEEMFVSFPSEVRLWSEIQTILEVIQCDTTETRNVFLTEIFAAISTHTQCQMLLNVAEKINDTLDQCRMLLLAMRKFSNLVNEHGLKLLETLHRAEREAKFSTPVNCYRKLFVCDVLPLVLQKCKTVELATKQYYKWLNMAIEFYVIYITQSPNQSTASIGIPQSSDLLSPTKRIKKVYIARLNDKESLVQDPWGNLLKLLIHVGSRIGWDEEGDLFTQSRPKVKKAKTDGTPQIIASNCVTDSQKITQSFLMAFKCYELLNSTPDLQREFLGLCESWKMETWSWMGHYQTDMLMYQGAFQDAVEHLQNFSSTTPGSMQIRNSIQMACCYFCLGKLAKACEMVLNVIKDLPDGQPRSEADIEPVAEGTGRHLVLTKCTDSQILPYSIELLLSCFKERALSSKQDDDALGHMIVLLQYDWPKQGAVFLEATKKIQTQGSFTYNLFFNYVVSILLLKM